MRLAGVADRQLAAPAAHPPPPTRPAQTSKTAWPKPPSNCLPPPSTRTLHFSDTDVIRAALDQRLRSRIIDRHRALGGRSPITAVRFITPLLETVTDPIATTGGDPLPPACSKARTARAESPARFQPTDMRSAARPALSNSTAMSVPHSSAHATAGAPRNTAYADVGISGIRPTPRLCGLRLARP